MQNKVLWRKDSGEIEEGSLTDGALAGFACGFMVWGLGFRVRYRGLNNGNTILRVP